MRSIHPRGFGTMAALFALSVWVGPVKAAIPGFTEDFIAGTGSFFSQATVAHVSSGGVGGAGDGYLSVARTKADHLGVAGFGPEFNGNLVAAGVTGFSFWLNDVGADEPLSLHVGVGQSFNNFWLYIPAFSPPENAWGQFIVDFSNPGDWVRIRGSGTFQQALMTSDRLLFRHDEAPLEWFPDPIAGDFGLDRVTVLPEPAALALLAAGGLLSGKRRRSYWRIENGE